MNQQPAWKQPRGSDLVVLVVLGAIVLGVIAAGATHPGLTEKARTESCISHVSLLAKAMRLYSRLPIRADVCGDCDAPCANACPVGVPIAEFTRQAHRMLTLEG